MKVFSLTFSILFLLAECESSKTKATKSSQNFKLLSSSINNITKLLFKSCGEVSIIKYRKDKKTIQSVILNDLRENNIPARLIIIKTSIKGSGFHWGNSIITLKSFKRLKEYLELRKITIWGESKSFVSYLTYVHAFNSNLEFLKQMNLNATFIKNYYFLIEDKYFIRLKTFVWFLPGNCGKPNLIEINSFAKKDKSWRNSQFTMKKFRNFFNCSIYLYKQDHVIDEDFVKLFHLGYFSEHFQGNYGFKKHFFKRASAHDKLNKALANHFNYSVKTRLRVFSRVEDFAVDFRTYDQTHTKVSSEHIRFYTKPHVFQSLYFGVPIGAEYDGYEKLVLPFDDPTWILIIVTFIVTFSSIFVAQLVPVNIRDFVIGRNVQTPALNILLIVFGIGQIELPKRNFARLLVVLFIIYCLIMRTAWQGMMFEFLQKDMRRPEIQSIEEMVEKNFTFYLTSNVIEFLEGSDFFEANRKRFVETYIIDLLTMPSDNLTDPNFKGVVQVLHDDLRFQMLASNGTILRRFLKHPLHLQMMCFGFQNDLLLEDFDEKIQQLVTGGLIDYFDWDNREFIKPERYAHLQYEGPEILTMKDLEAGFVVWLVTILFAVFAFIFEWSIKFFEYLMFNNVLKAFYVLRKFSM